MSSKTDAFVKLGIVFSISLLSFSIGIFAGKKYSDNQHQLAILEPQKNAHGESREIASMPAAPGTEGRSGAMTDDEIAKLAEEFVADDTVPAHGAATDGHGEKADAHGAPAAPAHGAAPAKEDAHGTGHQAENADTHKPAPAAKPAPVTKHDEPSSAAKNIVDGKAPVAPTTTTTKTVTKKVEERLPSSLPKDVAQFSVGKFTVQVAAHQQEGDAQKMASDLKSKGYSAFYIPANVKGTTYYRVSVGQFATQKEAQNYRSEFLAKSKLSSAIVQKISE